MRIGLDASYTLARAPSGVAVYSRNLLQELLRQAPGDRFHLGYRANRFLPAWRQPRPRNASPFLLENVFTVLYQKRFDLFHGLNQRLPRTRFRRTAATFHDLFVLTAEYSTPDFRQRFERIARETAERADLIIAVSEFTASQVRELLGFPADRIVVIHHGVRPPARFAPEDSERFRQKNRLDRPFLLHVGAIQKRKNVVRLIQALERLPSDLELVLAGSDGYGAASIREAIAESPAAARVRLLGYVDETTRAGLYQTATALAFPSLDEGFGLPVLEALAAGLPALTSNRSALPEAADGAALLVDPFSVDSIADGLRRIVDDTALRENLCARGLRRAAELTWERAGQQTLDLYRRLAGR